MKVETEFLEEMTGERMGTEVIKLDGTFPFHSSFRSLLISNQLVCIQSLQFHSNDQMSILDRQLNLHRPNYQSLIECRRHK